MLKKYTAFMFFVFKDNHLKRETKEI